MGRRVFLGGFALAAAGAALWFHYLNTRRPPTQEPPPGANAAVSDPAPGAPARTGAPPPAGPAPVVPVPSGPVPNPTGEPYLPLVEPYASLKTWPPDSAEGRLAARLEQAAARSPNGRQQRVFATLRVRLDYLGYAATPADELARLAGQAARGADPFAEERGTNLRGYFAPNDASCQPFSVALPDNYRPDRVYPLVLFLHHHGWGDWYRPFQGHPVSSLPEAIVAAPHGRGSCDYLWIAEDDARAVLDAMLDDYPIDRTRVYVTGWSMGGTGSFHLPSRYPDRFAASYPQAGNADFTAWEEAWKEDRQRAETPWRDARLFLRLKWAPVAFAENYLHVPIHMDHGELDSINPVGHSKKMSGRLRELGYDRALLRTGEGGHGWGAGVDERFEWLKTCRIPAAPDRVRFKTCDYRHDSAYWVQVLRLRGRMAFAEIDVRRASPVRLEVTRAENVERFRLKLDGLALGRDAVVALGPQELRLPQPTPAATELERTADGWRIAPPRSDAPGTTPA